MPSKTHLLTISLATHNGERLLPTCLAGIKSQTFKDFDLTVFDDHSQDASVDSVRREFPQARIVESEKNCGFAQAHNECIRQSQSAYVLVLNQDVFMEETYCQQLVDFMESHPECAEISGTLFRCDELTSHPSKSILDACGMEVVKRYFVRNRKEGLPAYFQDTAPMEVFGVPATAVLYRRSALSDVAFPQVDGAQFFDQDHFMYKEDVDLSFRLRWRGWKAALLPNAAAHHVRTQRKGVRDNSRINELSYQNTLFVEIKNISGGLFARIFPQLIFFEIAKFFFLCIFERETLQGLKNLLVSLPRMKTKRRFILSRRVLTNKEMFSWFLTSAKVYES